MKWLEFLYQHPDRILREVLVVFFLYLFNFDYKKRKPFGLLYWLAILATLFVTILVLAITAMMVVGTWNAVFHHQALFPLAPLLLVLFLLCDVMVYFCIRRLIRMTQYYRKLKEKHL